MLQKKDDRHIAPSCGRNTSRSGCRMRGRPVVYSPDERRQLILDAVDSLFGAGGVRMLTISAIARESGMSRRTLYDIFGDRDSLLLAYMERLVAQCLQPLEADKHDLPLEARLRLLLTPRQRNGSWDLPLAILRQAMLCSADTPEIGRRCLEIGPGRFRTLIREELERGVARGELPATLDTDAAAALLRDMIQVPVLEVLLDDACRPDDAVTDARLDLGLRVFLGGIAAGV
ncbi:TetR/AcrR family transcriptional regulator [Pseudooceanicola algae]|nr:TetR/AcrR family transcriptional regulator [Pseudooceanicola algae]